jgi:AmpD protein
MYEISDGWLNPANIIESPNYNERPENITIDAIVLHSISLPPGCYGGHDIEKLFTNTLDHSKDLYFQQIKDMKVSSHLLINRTGELIQFVNLYDRAWHAGQSELYGSENCNNFSIGIELEGTDTTPFDMPQYQTLRRVIGCIIQHFPHITPQRVVGHCDIAPERKTDPGSCFDWEQVSGWFETA